MGNGEGDLVCVYVLECAPVHVSVSVHEADGAAVVVSVVECVTVAGAVRDDVQERVCVNVSLWVKVAVYKRDSDLVDVGVPVRVAVQEGEGGDVLVLVGVCVAVIWSVHVPEAVGDREAVAVTVLVWIPVAELDRDGVVDRDADGVPDGVLVCDGVSEGFGVQDLVALAVAVRVCMLLSVAVPVTDNVVLYVGVHV